MKNLIVTKLSENVDLKVVVAKDAYTISNIKQSGNVSRRNIKQKTYADGRTFK